MPGPVHASGIYHPNRKCFYRSPREEPSHVIISFWQRAEWAGLWTLRNRGLSSTREAGDERECRIVEYHFFGGLTHREIAEIMGLSPITVHRSWMAAKARLQAELSEKT